MRRKRLNHYADVVCKMFVGWRMGDDLEAMSELPDGTILVNLLTGEAYHAIAGPLDLHIAKEIKAWLEQQGEQEGVDIGQLESATLEIDIHIDKVATTHKKVVIFDIECNSKIKTNEMTYKANIKDMHQWHTRVTT